MKKVILAIVLFSVATAINAQSQTPAPAAKKSEYSVLWGLFKSDNYAKNAQKSFVFETNTAFKTQTALLTDSTNVNKSILWGAIQWSEKKK